MKEAFYRLSKIHHPDANANNEAALKQFQNISEAYEVLRYNEALGIGIQSFQGCIKFLIQIQILWEEFQVVKRGR